MLAALFLESSIATKGFRCVAFDFISSRVGGMLTFFICDRIPLVYPRSNGGGQGRKEPKRMGLRSHGSVFLDDIVTLIEARV